MSEGLFDDPPNIPLLQWLARGSLKQNLSRGIRLWVWLHYLYGENALPLGDSFTYPEWRDAFFSPTHPKQEKVPNLHDVNCTCAKTTGEWLFENTGISQPQWQRSLQQHIPIPDSTLDDILKKRLFEITRRSLQDDLKILVELGWLQRQNQKYYRVREFPHYPTVISGETKLTQPDSYNQAFINVDVGAIAQIYSQPIRGIQRFFLELDYIIFSDNQDRVDDLLHKFRHLWEQPTTPPVKLTYNSARLNKSHKYIVYPVCIYYVRRAVYLCAFGETVESTGEWYNYRLDRIQNLTPLQWDNPNIPQFLFQHYQHQTLPTPDYIQEQMGAAWGFDFYLPSRLMVLRFVRNFHDRYVQNTFRHHTFQLINYQQVEKLIQKNTPPPHQQHLLTVFKSRNRHDAYYRAYYRENDTNVKMRLRAWRPHVEVLLPWQLRQKIAEETAAEYQYYF